MINGAAASPGVVIGPVYVVDETEVSVPNFENPATAFNDAAATVANDLRDAAKQAKEADRSEASEILTAQAMMAEDAMLAGAVDDAIGTGAGLGEAIKEAAGGVAAVLAGLDDPYLAARAADIGEIAERIRRQLAGVSQVRIANEVPSVIVAHMLTAADTAVMDPSSVLGLITETGGPTGHVAVIARSLAIPAVVGVSEAATAAAGSTTVAIDGERGDIVFDPDADQLAAFESRRQEHETMLANAATFSGKSIEVGGNPIRIAANVGTPDDIDTAVAAKADGVGLFRTEFLFLDRSSPPSQEEQYQLYAKAAAAFEHPVVVRTFDIGGDKPAPYIGVGEEENPFLGVRGVRLYGREADIFVEQAKAIARAAIKGDIWMMIPMVATVADFAETLELVARATGELDAAGIEWSPFKVGVMVEVPSAALLADRLAEHVDFFSIGTNDLTQYTLASDRTAGDLASYQDPVHPAVLQLCHKTAQAAQRAGISVAVCGEAASDLVAASLFMDMGIDKLSVSSPRVNVVKSHIDGSDRNEERLATCLAAASADEVREIVGAP